MLKNILICQASFSSSNSAPQSNSTQKIKDFVVRSLFFSRYDGLLIVLGDT